MTAILTPIETVTPNHPLDLCYGELFDPNDIYNNVALRGLKLFDAVLNDEIGIPRGSTVKLARFPYVIPTTETGAWINRQVENARESFLIGMMIKTDALSRIADIVVGVENIDPFSSRKELMRFGGRVILEVATFGENYSSDPPDEIERQISYVIAQSASQAAGPT